MLLKQNKQQSVEHKMKKSFIYTKQITGQKRMKIYWEKIKLVMTGFKDCARWFGGQFLICHFRPFAMLLNFFAPFCSAKVGRRRMAKMDQAISMIFAEQKMY